MSTDSLPSSVAAGVAGRAGEKLAEAYLQQRGLHTIARNYRCRLGEIDLIMRDEQTLVFVEVRYRGSQRFGGAAGSVGQRKQARIIRAASVFLLAHSEYANRPCRFDVVALQGQRLSPSIDWIAGAFSA